MACDTSRVLSVLQDKATETRDPEVLGTCVVGALMGVLPQATWVGIYWLRGQTLVLGPYEGADTEHTRIPIGHGVCGTAVAEDRDQVVDDVSKVRNYLACSPSVRSEIVVLIRTRGEVIGQIDVDSDQLAAFDGDDHCVIRAVADSFGGLVEPQSGIAHAEAG